jgi:hypothetical protein
VDGDQRDRKRGLSVGFSLLLAPHIISYQKESSFNVRKELLDTADECCSGLSGTIKILSSRSSNSWKLLSFLRYLEEEEREKKGEDFISISNPIALLFHASAAFFDFRLVGFAAQHTWNSKT